jgi:hypothetical protein
MYLSVTLIVLGEALLARSPALGIYWAVWFSSSTSSSSSVTRVLRCCRFGTSCDEYARQVGRWFPKHER